MKHNKYYTLEEADKLIDEITFDLCNLVGYKAELDDKGFDIYNHIYFGGRGPNGTGEFPEELELLVNILKKFNDKGIIVKSLDIGLIDIPGVDSDGEKFYYCYEVKEDSIEYWHYLNEGYNDRKKILRNNL